MISNSRGTLFNGDESPFVHNRMMETLNAYRYLWGYGGRGKSGFETRFDLNKECDLPETHQISIADYRTMFDRNPIAARVVEVMPEDCWQAFPEVFESEDPEDITEFEQAMLDLAKSLRGEESWYAGQEGNLLWSYCHRADLLSGIGHFGLILIGIDDGKQLHEPIDGFEDEKFTGQQVFVANKEKPKPHKLIFLSVFDESAVLEGSVQYELDSKSVRYRKPKRYQLTLGQGDAETATRDSPTLQVHWSRVIHIPSQLLSSDVLGVPLQRPVWDNLLGLRRIYAVDPVAVWKNVARRTWLETHPQLGGDVTVDEASLRAMMWDMDNTQQKNAILKGMTAKTDSPSLADPKSHIDTQIEAICIKLNIPKRKFVGAAPGQLGGAGDAEESDDSWSDVVRGKRVKRCIPYIVVPLIDRFIQIGVLPIPPKGYFVAWDDPSEMQPMERADLAVKRTDAMSKYVAGGLQVIMDPMDFLTRELGLDEEEAVEILTRAAEFAEASQPEEPPMGEEPPVDAEQEAEAQAEAVTNLLVNAGFVSEAQRKAVFAKLGGAFAVRASSGQQRGPGGKFGKGNTDGDDDRKNRPKKPEDPKKAEKAAEDESVVSKLDSILKDHKKESKEKEKAAQGLDKVKRSPVKDKEGQTWLAEWTGEEGGQEEYDRNKKMGAAWVAGEKNPALDAVYLDTQVKLREAGIEEVKAYRGVRLTDDHPLMKDIQSGKLKPGDEIEVDGMGFVGWSSDSAVGSSYAKKSQASLSGEKGSKGVVFERVIASEDIVAGHAFQPGFIDNEKEIIARNKSPKIKIRIAEIH